MESHPRVMIGEEQDEEKGKKTQNLFWPVYFGNVWDKVERGDLEGYLGC